MTEPSFERCFNMFTQLGQTFAHFAVGDPEFGNPQVAWVAKG